MAEITFRYVTYIAAVQDQVWRALLDPATTAKYWQHVNVSDWNPGSRWEHRRSDQQGTVDLVGKVLEIAPPRRLVLSWAFPGDEARAERHSKVTLEVEPYREVVRLAVTHERLDPGSEMLEGISDGWPMVLSSLKTLLELGRPLPVLW